MSLLMVQSFLLFSQERKVSIDTILIKKDSLVVDTLLLKNSLSKDAIEIPIIHVCKGYRRTDLINKKVWLVQEAEVTYGDIILKADSIELDMETGQVFAIGRKDSTGKIIGSPIFKQGSEEFDSKELTYNFKTKKGIIRNIFTKQEEGYLNSKLTKRMDDESLNIFKSTFSTCDLEHPHFSINFTKAKVIPGKKIISGPAYLVLQDVPLPLALPFGFFPEQKKRASGLMMPKYGESQQLGYSLSDGGYYFVINDNIDLSVTGSLYTNGTWMINSSSRYLKKYKYSGNFSLSYASNISGHKGLPDYNKTSNYRIDWTYNQDAKARPGSRFSASVNMSSSGFDRNNSYTVNEHINTQRQSSVSYSKNWEGTPFNLSASLNHSQNVRNKTVSLNLPKVNFNVARIYPLKSKNNQGASKWYQELQFSYSASVDNQINTTDSLFFTKEIWKDMRNGFRHEIPVSFQLRPFRNFTISPQVMYSGVLFTQKMEKRWVADYYNPDLNKIVPTVINDTLRGFFYGQAVNPSISASFSPQIFGIFDFSKSGSRIQKIRHVIRPSVSFSYVPVLKGLSTDMYRDVQIDTAGRTREYSIFEGNIFSTPSLSRRSGILSFNLVNILEAKVFEKKDTTGKPKNVKIIDNFTINSSYNIFADSLRWSAVNMNYQTRLFENLNLQSNAGFSLYASDSLGRNINAFYYSQTKKLMRLTNVNASLDFDLSQLFSKRKKKEVQNVPQAQSGARPEDDGYGSVPARNTGDGIKSPAPINVLRDEFGYVKFDLPWTLHVNYNINYYKSGLKPVITQQLALNGTLALTKKTNISYTTGYDIARKEITVSSVSISRDLHCWDMSFNWIPIGYIKSWNFTIRVKASVLQDLKYERRKDFHDQY